MTSTFANRTKWALRLFHPGFVLTWRSTWHPVRHQHVRSAARSWRTAVSYTLVGPPEARHAAASATEAVPTGDAFVDLKVLTEKLSPTFVSSGDPYLDFFFNVVPGTSAASVASLLAGVWAADPATALRLVANLRGLRVFVFSDMEFDQASAQPWETDYEAIVRKFTEASYGAAVPKVVFWNLRDSKAVPVTSGQKGVALVSWFSKNLLMLFLDGGGIITPRAIMEKAITGPEYDKLAVFD